MTKYTSSELVKLSKQTADPRMRLRLLAISHFVDGKNRTQIASITKVSRRIINQWVGRYLSHGIAGLASKKSPGRPSRLTDLQTQRLADMLSQEAESEAGGRLTGEDIRQYILTEFGITFHLNHIYKLLSKLGFSWQTSRSRHPKQKPEVIETFKKVPAVNDR